MEAFAQFHDTFSLGDPWPAIRALSSALGLVEPNEDEDAQVALHQLLSDNEDLRWVRARTARNATSLSELAEECWPSDTEQVIPRTGYSRASRRREFRSPDGAPGHTSNPVDAGTRVFQGSPRVLGVSEPELPAGAGAISWRETGR